MALRPPRGLGKLVCHFVTWRLGRGVLPPLRAISLALGIAAFRIKEGPSFPNFRSMEGQRCDGRFWVSWQVLG